MIIGIGIGGVATHTLPPYRQVNTINSIEQLQAFIEANQVKIEMDENETNLIINEGNKYYIGSPRILLSNSESVYIKISTNDPYTNVLVDSTTVNITTSQGKWSVAHDFLTRENLNVKLAFSV